MSDNKLFFGYENFEIERPFDFSAHSSIGCGGQAPIAFYPHNEEELKTILLKLKEVERGYLLLGNMTNVLPSDLEMKKVVVCTKKLKKTELFPKEGKVYAEAGVTSANFLRALRYAGLSGAEFLTGIPCTLGGALYMNAGAGGKYISEIVESVRVYREGEIFVLPIEECLYSYKTSRFMQTKDVILGATLLLEKSEEKEVSEREKVWAKRRAHLPKGKSMGCVFKNPSGFSAGELIEKAGLKGKRVGGAKVSETHANFIINDARATSKEIRMLIGQIKAAVYAYCGVVLEEEIQYLN